MKRLIAVVVMAALLAPVAAVAQEGRPFGVDPAATARSHAYLDESGNGEFAGGFLAGLLLGPIGLAGTLVYAGSEPVTVGAVPDDEASAREYSQAYAEQVRSIRMRQALWGGVAGTLFLAGIATVVIVSANDP